MIKLRLRRMGAKKQPSYRIVAAESSKPRNGRFIETLGHYDPKTDPYTLRVNEERAKYWLDNGAQPTETVRSLLVKSGVLPPYQSSSTRAAETSGTSSAAATATAEPATEAKPQAEPESSADAEVAEPAADDAPAERESTDEENS